MKFTANPFIAFICAIAGLTFAQSGKAPNATNAPITAFVNVNMVPMDRERIIENQTVIIREGRIAEIGPADKIKAPDGATRVDGAGKYLMPGLAEMHGHIPPPSAPKAYTESALFLYVANGVTTVRGMLGAPNQLELRDRANRGEIMSPTLYLAGPSFNGNAEAKLADVVRRAKAAGAGIVPTMALWETLIGYADLNALAAMPELKYVPPRQVEQWKTAHQNRINNPTRTRQRGDLQFIVGRLNHSSGDYRENYSIGLYLLFRSHCSAIAGAQGKSRSGQRSAGGRHAAV